MVALWPMHSARTMTMEFVSMGCDLIVFMILPINSQFCPVFYVAMKNLKGLVIIGFYYVVELSQKS